MSQQIILKRTVGPYGWPVWILYWFCPKCGRKMTGRVAAPRTIDGKEKARRMAIRWERDLLEALESGRIDSMSCLKCIDWNKLKTNAPSRVDPTQSLHHERSHGRQLCFPIA